MATMNGDDRQPAPSPQHDSSRSTTRLSRRKVLTRLGGLGIGTAAFQRALAVQIDESTTVTPAMIERAEWIAGIKLSEQDRETTARLVDRLVGRIQQLRDVEVEYAVLPALVFQPAPSLPAAGTVNRDEVRVMDSRTVKRPGSDEDLAFMPVSELASLVKSRAVTSVELTRLYLDRLRRYDPALHCVVNETADLAWRQSEQCDQEIARGQYRGPLHGIPWGAKDLVAYPGYKTTWGATPFKDQVIDVKATVAHRLEEAGAVLVAKLSMGALARGDRWFDQQTKNPWDSREGSSGSSAGSAAATAAGLVGFAIGSETMGSIVSPCRRCGVTGLRPTFGRVSRHGCMPLAWSMDKIGPIARSVEDCALVFAVIHGFDGLDPAAVDRPFTWPAKRDVASFKVGYVETRVPAENRPELSVLRDLGMKLIPITLPDKYPVSALSTIVDIEAATVFDDITRQGITEGLNNWPDTFREARFVTAVDYLRANRIRTLLIRDLEHVFSEVDAYVSDDDLALANLTGHPAVVVPNGLINRKGRPVPTSLTFTGRLYGESELLAIAHAYQQATGFHRLHPPLQKLLAPQEEKPSP
jgi:Asp-tRNA(Asn)/Glu-tRNA(Gln) amidotransferase A subunit family amidase